VNVEQDVRKVIERYRDAYERLDAAAARAVWPGVDEAALTRAFDGLTSQRIEFERCDIWLMLRARIVRAEGGARAERRPASVALPLPAAADRLDNRIS